MYIYYAYPSNLRLIKHLLLYSNNLHGCHHHSNKGAWQQTHVSHIKLLELGTHMITLTRGKEWHVDGVVLSFKKRDLQVIFPAIFKVRTYVQYVTACIYTSAMCRVHSCCDLIKPATSVYIVREQLIHHQSVVHMLARSKDFPIRVVRALFHTRVFFKFK